MELPELTAKLNDVFREVFDDPTIQIHDAMTARDVPAWDSLNHIQLIVAIEKAFRIKLTTREVQSLDTVGTLKALVARKAG
jgi:acyl carrier protein